MKSRESRAYDLHVQERLVLLELQPDPGRLTVAVSVVLGKDGLGLLALVVDVQPTWRLGNEPREKDDQAGEEHLQVHRNGPAYVAFESDSTSDGAGGQDGASEPEGIAVRSDNATWIKSEELQIKCSGNSYGKQGAQSQRRR